MSSKLVDQNDHTQVSWGRLYKSSLSVSLYLSKLVEYDMIKWGKEETKPAVNGMNIPRRRVNQGKIGNLDMIGEHDLNEVRSGVVQLTLSKFCPPLLTLTIYGSISTWLYI